MPARLGISLRREWVEPLLATRTQFPALEVIFEQWVFASAAALRDLERLRERSPFLLHCLGMNIGSSEPLDRAYFERVRAFGERFSVDTISDHLSWRSTGGQWALALLPLPRTEEALRHVATRVNEVQAFLGRAIALENVSQYLPTPGDIPTVEMSNALADRCGTAIHLDLNNLIVNERWLGESPDLFLDSLQAPIAWVHLAGHQEVPMPIDDHSRLPGPDCMGLLRRVGPGVPAIVEWDRERPPLHELLHALSGMEAGHVVDATV